ncbi:Arc family DNA-binding protein [Pseudomonas syringae]|uniref:Arc family DNA-binding protein n=1 Tax=Pseudomonas syringae TaxID=317 RepID=UPI001F345063|nr:Arc family DNA-binding protein [Pseudomonas syringae]MCF5382499.1 Arc family DNA-binding protein [Pseudomonas syringae]MCF5419386.1 Arc family DNA-binding protein [Pseudomonas syringae]MCF5451933.1 Arc family DNA-binding protein [Pseudomonas syringae]MCF5458717.1 Arc family DNA-binding protein [Pseudomonas syringae]
MSKQEIEPISRYADKFVTRMPDGMRARLFAYAKKRHLSMNSAAVVGMESFLSKHEELDALLAGVYLHKAALEAERRELAAMKAELEDKLTQGQKQKIASLLALESTDSSTPSG